MRYDKPRETSVYAEEGTAAHALGELALKSGRECSEWVGVSISTENGPWRVTEDMAEHTQTYVDYCRSLSGLHWTERTIDLAPLNPPEAMRGTSDYTCYTPETKQLEVVDLKYGQGVVVEVDWNAQALYYGLGALLAVQAEGHVVETVKITVVQPRAAHAAGVIRSFTLDVLDLLGWTGDLLASAHRAIAPDAPAVPGSWCRFCPGAHVCTALATKALAEAQVDFEVIESVRPPAPESLTREQLSKALTAFPMIEGWMKACEAYALTLGLSGDNVPGFKVVEKRATRRWVDTAEEQLRARGVAPADLYAEPEMRSPAQLEKQLKKKVFKEVAADLCPAVSSGYTLAPVEDAREPKRLSAHADFSVVG